MSGHSVQMEDSSAATDTTAEEDSTDVEGETSDDMAGMDMRAHSHHLHMKEPLVEPNGSGTAWLPKNSPVHDHAYHFSLGGWNVMTHGQAILRYTSQNASNGGKWPKPDTSTTPSLSIDPSGERGGRKIDGPNWFMAEGSRNLGDDNLVLRAMLSLDPLTETRNGYPLLFQTGEGLVDRQHPHDLFMELAAIYTHRFNDGNLAFAYFGLPGEPALGPVAFMHRPSLTHDPDAPLAHHMQDATHITYGVATLGWIYQSVKLDASAFRGREPDNHRWDIEAPAFDSYATRLTYNADPNFSAQISGGYLNDVEPDEPGTDILKTTASLDYSLPLGKGGSWSTSLIYGGNHFQTGAHAGINTQSYSLETDWDPGLMALWMRCENVERLGEELDLPASANRFFWIHTLSLGASKPVLEKMGMEVLVNAKGTANFIPSGLEADYGKLPLALEVFFTLRPARMKM